MSSELIAQGPVECSVMQHTPGPWSFYDDSNDGKTNRIEIVAIGKTVARIYHSVPDEDLPNAKLITAAPDLLAALKETFVLGDRLLDDVFGHEWLQQAKAAIAKATMMHNASLTGGEAVRFKPLLGEEVGSESVA